MRSRSIIALLFVLISAAIGLVGMGAGFVWIPQMLIALFFLLNAISFVKELHISM